MLTGKTGIKPNYSLSIDSYLYDSASNYYYLDCFSQYASLPLGYNHPIFDRNYEIFVVENAKNKNCNCEFLTEDRINFEKEFIGFAGLDQYDIGNFTTSGHDSCEQAIKAAIDISGKREGRVLYFSNQFSGIMGYGGFITDRVGASRMRLDGFTWLNWIKIDDIIDLKTYLRNKDDYEISCVFVEPIRCTAGDLMYKNGRLEEVFSLCKKHGVISIADEIQTGFGATGKVWFTDSMADIICFGKKAQVSGWIAKKGIVDKLNPSRYCITFDSSVVEMITSHYVIKAIKKYDLLNNVNKLSSYLLGELSQIKELKNVRGKGFLIAFDFETGAKRDEFYKNCFDNRLLTNSTAEKTIRLRPNLALSEDEATEIIKRIKKSI